MECNLLRLEVIGIWFTGFATFLAVVLALYLQRYTARRARPKLTLAHDSSKDTDKRYLPPKSAETPGSQEREEVWIRLRVKNDSNTSASNVEIRFIGILREGDKTQQQRPSWWLKVSNLNAVSVTIPPKFPQFFDLAYVKNEVGQPDISFYLTIVRPDLGSWPDVKAKIERSADTQMEVGVTYDLFVAIISSNADARFYRIQTKILPRRTGEPSGQLVGEIALRDRVRPVSITEVTADQAFSGEVEPTNAKSQAMPAGRN